MDSSRDAFLRKVVEPVISEVQGESSPFLNHTGETGLLTPRTAGDAEYFGGSLNTSAANDVATKPKSSWYLFLLTLGTFGQQMGWAVEMTNVSPYLLSLGLSKALLAFVWIAGPLTGVLVQPYVGLKSDQSRNRLGKRRPYIVVGALTTIGSLLTLAWARSIVTFFWGIFGAAPDSDIVGVTLVLFAVVLIYALDFSINVLQASQRAYAVDCTPHHQQADVNAWITRVTSFGNILGMFLAGIRLQTYFPLLGDSQMKILSAIACWSIVITGLISIVSIPERDPRLEPETADQSDGLLAILTSLWRAVFRLPLQMRRVCEVELFAWVGWFPILFYTTTYVAEIYADPYFEKNPHMSKQEVDALWEDGTRKGSIALLAFAVTTMISSLVLPLLLKPKYETSQRDSPYDRYSSQASGWTKIWVNSRKATEALSQNLHIPGLTLRKIWIYAHILFALLMWATLFVRSVTMATILVGLVGISWAVALWIPYALISAQISKRDAVRRGLIRSSSASSFLRGRADDSADKAGVVLGVHNASVSAPQVLATVIGSVLFSWLQKPRGEPGDNSVAWFFRVGGLCALGAAYWTWKYVAEDDDEAG